MKTIVVEHATDVGAWKAEAVHTHTQLRFDNN